MIIQCVWEHNGNDTLLYAANLPGAYARGKSLEIALLKMRKEAECYLKWTGNDIKNTMISELSRRHPANWTLQMRIPMYCLIRKRHLYPARNINS